MSGRELGGHPGLEVLGDREEEEGGGRRRGPSQPHTVLLPVTCVPVSSPLASERPVRPRVSIGRGGGEEGLGEAGQSPQAQRPLGRCPSASIPTQLPEAKLSPRQGPSCPRHRDAQAIPWLGLGLVSGPLCHPRLCPLVPGVTRSASTASRAQTHWCPPGGGRGRSPATRTARGP